MLFRSNIEKLPLKRCKAGIIENHVKWNFWSRKTYIYQLKTNTPKKNYDNKLQN